MAIEAAIADRELAWMFANGFPNTLDTTVLYHVKLYEKKPRLLMTRL